MSPYFHPASALISIYSQTHLLTRFALSAATQSPRNAEVGTPTSTMQNQEMSQKRGGKSREGDWLGRHQPHWQAQMSVFTVPFTDEEIKAQKGSEDIENNAKHSHSPGSAQTRAQPSPVQAGSTGAWRIQATASPPGGAPSQAFGSCHPDVFLININTILIRCNF